MVKSRVIGLTILLTAIATPGRAVELPAYRMGEVATNDVITTTRLLVVDDLATAELRDREARKIESFVVHSTNHAAFIEQEIRSALNRMREEFLVELEARYGTRRLLPEVLQSQAYGDLADQFLATNPGPPVTRGTLSAWAQGYDKMKFLDDWLEPLRVALQKPICPDRLPKGGRVREPMKFRMIRVDDLAVFVKQDFALSNSVRTFGSNLVLLSSARRELRESLPPKRGAVNNFLVKQLEPNCRFDTNLTERVKELAVSGLVRMKQFEPGEAVIRKGQVIDEKALAVLAEMSERARVVRLERQVAVNQVSVQLLGERNLWLVGLLGLTGLVLVWVVVRSRRRRRQELSPVLSSTLVHAGAEDEGLPSATFVEVPPAEQEGWQRRALEAERRAERANALAHSSLMPHLAQQLKDSVVQHLAAQMDDLLEVQTAAAEQLAVMQERLERMQAPLQERLRQYEQRISELEVELSQRGQENQLLLHARIEALRWQIDQEKSAEDQARFR